MCKFDLDQSKRKSSQVNANAHMRSDQTESQVDPSLNLRLLACSFSLASALETNEFKLTLFSSTIGECAITNTAVPA